MLNAKFLQTVMAVRGQNITLSLERPLKFKKSAAGHTGIKRSETKVRLGVDYDNMASVQSKREDGTLPSEPQPLPWGEWFSFPYLIKNGEQFYLRCSKPSDPNFVPKATYVLDGREVTKAELQASGLCLASEFAEKEDQDVFVTNVAHIKRIGNFVMG